MNETQKFKKYGKSFYLLLFGTGFGLPFLLSLIVGIVENDLRLDYFLPTAIVLSIIAWMAIGVMVGYGFFTAPFVKHTRKQADSLPYHFNSSFSGNNGTLLIDVERGVIGFISAYNPFEFQIFSASRISNVKTIASTMKGVGFVFYLDEKKITMHTIISNRAVNLKSQMGITAISKAETFANYLLSAKKSAEENNR